MTDDVESAAPMLAALGLLTVVSLISAIVSQRMSPLVALTIVPVAASLVGGFGWQTGQFIVSGLQQIAPVAAMFVFAILYFGIVRDAGLLDPIVNAVVRAAEAASRSPTTTTLCPRWPGSRSPNRRSPTTTPNGAAVACPSRSSASSCQNFATKERKAEPASKPTKSKQAKKSTPK